ncbi:type II CRISPR RNA-guided endonuclease Cas9 [Negadavirga shengliensis]|uniref:CRISPR-associated endonuclease Cas9 n=1 Tax=Negadavirga shengliensis TaxID=1389218 RepID=A0ABV9SVW4_9BACT
MKRILGLDLGTNSIGWALIERNFEEKKGKILGMGSRVIPMSQDILGDFGKGNSVSQTAERTRYRGTRRLRERFLLRRERLHRVLNIMDFLPKHYAAQIDFEKRLGKFLDETEPKLAYDGKAFVFKKSFEEMLCDFRQYQPQLLNEGRLISYDWTIYYLRKKALSQKIEKEELAWIILNFNQKRGYYQLRGGEEEEEEHPNKLVEFYSLKITDVVADEETNKKGETWYSLILENGWIYRRSSNTDLSDWKDKVRDFIITTDLNDDGSVKKDKEGKEKRSFRAPQENDWTLIKKKTEQEINKAGKTVGAFIYDTLLENPQQKVKGKLVRTIERKFYKEELKIILKKQKIFHPELSDEGMYSDCVKELYRNNETHQSTLGKKDFVHLFVEDIIFYQRPLKSQKSSIANCALEYRKYRVNGEEKIEYLKAVPKSNPYYQEFRVWQWLYNLKIYQTDDEIEVTRQFLNNIEDWENLFEFLMDHKEVDHKDILKYLLASKELRGKALNSEIAKYRWNYVYDPIKNESKKYPCNETGYEIRRRINNVSNVPSQFLTQEIEYNLWHIIYSVTDKEEYEKALKTFAERYGLDADSFLDNFKKFPAFKSEYGSFSLKAIKRLLPILRLGKYWSWDAIDEKTKRRIDKIITGEYDEEIENRVREKVIDLTEQHHFQGLQLWLASYIVYDRHSEANIVDKWNSVSDLDAYISEFKQHSLRNPIAEQVITETLRVVRDIWLKYGAGAKDYFDKIHVELGREMKNPADRRKQITNQITENENTNLRIKALLTELKNDEKFENVRPYSPMQQEILKVYEEGVLHSNIDIPEDVEKISKKAEPTRSELLRYKLWLEQKYRSPYTGEIIPFTKLFTPEYEIEHIIPQSRYFDDSFSNKVICESVVNNPYKNHQLGLEFIKNQGGKVVDELSKNGKIIRIFTEEEYVEFVKEHYSKNRAKRNKLLMEDIPERMIERQINDTRYISKFVTAVLSNIVRSEIKDDGTNSKNLIPGNGKITSTLKQDWGLNDVWNSLVLPRFERMNRLTNSKDFTSWNDNHQKYLPTVPLELSKGFQKKRLDHRHHALDALIIACATREHINFMNNVHALHKKKTKTEKQQFRYDLRSKLCYKKYNEGLDQNYRWIFKKPWKNFTVDAQKTLETIVVSFKQNLRVINRATNTYESYKDENGNIRIGKDEKPEKGLNKQNGINWAIRKPMHKETVSGLIKLRKKREVSLNIALDNIPDITDKPLRKEIQSLVKLQYDKKLLTKYFKDRKYQWNSQDVSRVEIYYWESDMVASRTPLDTSFSERRIKDSVTDTGIQRILLAHLDNYIGHIDEKGKPIAPELLAFTPEGIDEMNKNIVHLNGGKFHQPILKVRTYEPKGNKFIVGETGNKKKKFVEAAKGTNLFFVIYQNSDGKRSYDTIPLNIVIERQKQGLIPVPEINEKGDKLLFHLSPNDLVYVPEEEENIIAIDFNSLSKEQTKRIYKMVSSSGTQCFFIKQDVSTSIVNKLEYSALNKMERSVEGVMIKDRCWKLKIDRLGNVSKA